MEQICKTLLKSHIHFIHSAVLQNYQFHKDASPSSNPFQFYLVRYSKNQYNKLTVQKKYFLKKFISIIQWWFYKFKNSILIGPKLTQLFDGAIKATQSTKFNYLINPTFSIIWLDTEKKQFLLFFIIISVPCYPIIIKRNWVSICAISPFFIIHNLFCFTLALLSKVNSTYYCIWWRHA